MSKTVAPTAALPDGLPPAPSATMPRPGVRGTPAAPYVTTDHERREPPAGAVDLRDRSPASSAVEAMLCLCRAVEALADQQGNGTAHASAERARRFFEQQALAVVPGVAS